MLPVCGLQNIAHVNTAPTPDHSDHSLHDALPISALTIVKETSDPTVDHAGAVIHYTIAVDNTGNIDLTNPVVTDPFADAGSLTFVGGDTHDLGVLDTDEIWHYTATHTVTQAEMNAGGTLQNIAHVHTDRTPDQSDDATTTVEQNPALTIVKETSDPTVDHAGAVIHYTIAVDNTGNIDLTNPVVTDPFADAGSLTFVGGDTHDLGVLDTDEIWHYTATHTVTQAEMNAGGTLQNIAHVHTDRTPDQSDDATTTVEQNPALTIVKETSDPTVDHAGAVIHYTIAVDNTGNIDLTNPVVTDPFADAGSLTFVGGDTHDLGVLDTDEIWHYTATHTVTQAEMNAGGTLQNIAHVHTDRTPDQSDDATTTVEQNPALTIVKETSDPTVDHAGAVIHYTIAVDNTGNIDLTNPVVTDPFADAGSLTFVGGDTHDLGVLDTDEIWHYTATHTVTQAEMNAGGTLQNIAHVHTDDTKNDGEEETTTVEQSPALTIVKETSDPTVDHAGAVIHYTIAVDNTGNIDLTNPVVTDPFADAGSLTFVGGDTHDLGVLDTDEIWHYTATHTVTQAEMNAGGTLQNIAHVHTDRTPDQSDDATTTVEQNPALTIVKETSDPTDDHAGAVIHYTIAVDTTVNIYLTNSVVTEPFANAARSLHDALPIYDLGVLDTDEIWHYTATHTVTQAEMNAGGTLQNIAHVHTDRTPDQSDDATTTVEQNPALTIVKETSDPTVDHAGAVIHYTIAVDNTGNIDLTNPVVTDPFADAGSLTFVGGDTHDLGVLDTDEIWHYTATHTVTQAEMDAGGTLVNLATVDTTQTEPQSDDATTTVIQHFGVHIDKTASIADGHADKAGDIITYNVVLTNTGNAALDGVVVVDQFESNPPYSPVTLTNFNSSTNSFSGDTDHDGKLDVNETWTYTYTHQVTQTELTTLGIDGDGSLDNVATVTTDNTTPASDDASIPILLGPGVRTPGFWSQNTGQNQWTKFWDGTPGNEPKQAGTDGFPKGELTYAVDSNHDNQINGSDSKGLLIGDFNTNGLIDNGEHAIFISLADALTLVSASQKQQQDQRYVLARDEVATWLNFLSGNGIGDASDPNSPRHYIDDAARWLDQTTNGD